MTARLIYCMGPSGAGKDSLLDWLRAHLPTPCPVYWAQRTISRIAVPGGETHESVSPKTFAALCREQAFALHWEANSLSYGIRHAQLAPLAQGHWVLLNGSRAYLPEALAQFPDLVAVHISASPQVLRERLLSRGRETPDLVEARVQRAIAFLPPPGTASLEVHNDGALNDAGQQLLHALGQLPGWPTLSGKLSHRRLPIRNPSHLPMTAFTIYHNPKCGTSRNTLAMIRNSGVEPEIIEYLKTPPDRATLVALVAATGEPAISVVRTKEPIFAELQLDAAGVTDAQLIEAMLQHPILINRPIVATPLGTRLCRPSEKVLDILPTPQQGAFIKESGKVVTNVQDPSA